MMSENKVSNKPTKVLLIGAHNDEIEYSCGGLLCYLAEAGCHCTCLVVSNKHRLYGTSDAEKARYMVTHADQILYDRQDSDAAAVLGAKKVTIGACDNSFYQGNQEDVDLIHQQVEHIQPDVAFVHWPSDRHLEHRRVAKSSLQALSFFSDCDIYAFEAGSNQTMPFFMPHMYIDISPWMDRIRSSLSKFNQPTANGSALAAEKVVSARFRGQMCGMTYAEGYRLVRFPAAHKSNSLFLPRVLGQTLRWSGHLLIPGQDICS